MSSSNRERAPSHRKLRAEEQALWELATTSVTRVNRNDDTSGRHKPPGSTRLFESSGRIDRNELFALGQSQSIPDDATVRMDKKIYQRMQRGKLSPEGILDLHGLTVEQAHTELTRFIKTGYATRHRLLLVITGKGGRRPDEDHSWQPPTGVLRRLVPRWLRTPPLSQVVLQQSFAHERHGGSGALYVYLRRQRQNPVAQGK